MPPLLKYIDLGSTALEAKENKISEEELDAFGAGNQGMMFGFATDETEEYMPYPITLTYRLVLQLGKSTQR